jgi:hypothetical protein
MTPAFSLRVREFFPQPIFLALTGPPDYPADGPVGGAAVLPRVRVVVGFSTNGKR